MKISILIAIMTLVIAGFAFAQVDTMRLLEVGSVTAPGAITNWYFEDLNGDNIKEIILTTANSVNIYSGQSFAPIWSQSGFTNPKDLNFADINNDGLVDFSVKDTSHIYLIDPHHSATLWTSPMLDSLYRCYTIGDGNRDGYNDISYIMFEGRDSLLVSDSNRIYTVYGPGYNTTNDMIFYSIDSTYGHYPESGGLVNEEISSFRICRITDGETTNNYMIIFTRIINTHFTRGGYYDWHSSGGIFIIDALALHTTYRSISIGNYGYYSSDSTAQGTFLNILWSSSAVYQQPSNYTTYWNCGIISLIADSLVYSQNLRSSINSYPRWKGMNISDISLYRLGKEICFGIEDSLILGTFPNYSMLWAVTDITDMASIKYLYKSSIDSVESNFIVYKTTANINTYVFCNAEYGNTMWVLRTGDVLLEGVINILNTRCDLFFAINHNSLVFYTIAPRICIDNPNLTPSAFYISPNYPNPFNASTVIEYGLPESGPVKVEIFDILGRKVQTLIDETQLAGYHQVIWNGEDAPSGTYFYRIQAGEKSQTKKCLLLK